VVGTENLIAHATTYYKSLFGPSNGNVFELKANLWEENEQVTPEDNSDLVRHFEMEEIRGALFDMEKNKAAGPHGFPIEFYQVCREFIKDDFMDLFRDFSLGILDIKRLNYGIITLLPKTKEANKIQQFMPICMLNYIYKWFTKCLTKRLNPIAGKIIHKAQSAFIPGRNIMNSVLALHETKIKKKVGVVLKLDFKKAYDKVCWEFLLKCMKVIGFCNEWCSWIRENFHWDCLHQD
jgi:hypothetical protein